MEVVVVVTHRIQVQIQVLRMDLVVVEVVEVLISSPGKNQIKAVGWG